MTPNRISPALSRDRREDGQDRRCATPPLPEHAGRADRGASSVADDPLSACIFATRVSTVTSGRAQGFAGKFLLPYKRDTRCSMGRDSDSGFPIF